MSFNKNETVNYSALDYAATKESPGSRPSSQQPRNTPRYRLLLTPLRATPQARLSDPRLPEVFKPLVNAMLFVFVNMEAIRGTAMSSCKAIYR